MLRWGLKRFSAKCLSKIVSTNKINAQFACTIGCSFIRVIYVINKLRFCFLLFLVLYVWNIRVSELSVHTPTAITPNFESTP